MITIGLETLLNTTNYTIKSWVFFIFIVIGNKIHRFKKVAFLTGSN